MRQQNIHNDSEQAKFIELLPRLRDGTSTYADWQLLLTRVPNVSNKIGFENAISIFNDNDSVDKANLEGIFKVKSQITEIRAINSTAKGASTSLNQFSNLVNSLNICNGCKVTLVSNIWIKKGKKKQKNIYLN